MRQLLTIFGFSLRRGLRKQSFWLSNVIMMVLILILCLIPFLQNLRGQGSGEGSRPGSVTAEDFMEAERQAVNRVGTCYYIDELGQIPEGISALSRVMPSYTFIQGSAGNLELYKSKAADDGSVSIIIVTAPESGSTLSVPGITIINRDIFNGMDESTIKDALSRQYISHVMGRYGAKSDLTQLLEIQLPTDVELATELDMSGYILGFAITLLTFYVVWYYGGTIATSIADEKASNIMESLVASASPGKILWGKMLAMEVLALLQFILIMGFGVMCFELLVPENYRIMGMRLSMDMITTDRVVMILVGLLMGFVLYAMMNAFCGAAVKREEDVHSIMLPVGFIASLSLLIGVLCAIGAVSDTSLPGLIAGYFPLISPFYLPFMILKGDVNPVSWGISIVVMMVAAILVAIFAQRFYKQAVSVGSVGQKKGRKR
ncbi:MAG: ABC transporter permease [Firmicutes bacterium]|nr:ABC transporter permease [Bacillota bacterium]